MELPKRKKNRLPFFDCGSAGLYFITVCTQNKKKIFWATDELRNGQPQLSEAGLVVNESILTISKIYPSVFVDQYAVMPNHIHLLLRITAGQAPTISYVVGQLKRAVSLRLGEGIWQKSFHDHVVRGYDDYSRIWEYIAYNPLKWNEDCFYAE